MLKRNIAAVAEALTKVLYGILDTKNMIYAEGYEGLNSGFLEQLAQFLQRTPRFPTKLARNSDTMKDLQKLFYKMMPNATKHGFEYKEVTFYTNAASTMKAIKVKSRLTDMFLFVLIALYLLALYIYMKVLYMSTYPGRQDLPRRPPGVLLQ